MIFYSFVALSYVLLSVAIKKKQRTTCNNEQNEKNKITFECYKMQIFSFN